MEENKKVYKAPTLYKYACRECHCVFHRTSGKVIEECTYCGNPRARRIG